MSPFAKSLERELASVCLVGSSGDVVKVPRGLLVSASPCLAGALDGCASPVLLMPDVTPKQMARLLRRLQGEVLEEAEEELSDIAWRYNIALPSSNSEVPLPLKKRQVDFTPPSSPESQASLPEFPRATPSPPPEALRSHGAPNTPTEHLGSDRATLSPPMHSPSAPSTPSPFTSPTPVLPAFPLLPYMLARGLVPAPHPAALHGLQHLLPHFPAILRPHPATPAAGQRTPVSAPRPPAEGSRAYITCEDCGKEILETSIHTHRRRHHRQLQEPVLCCGERFPTRWHLNAHRRAAHSRSARGTSSRSSHIY